MEYVESKAEDVTKANFIISKKLFLRFKKKLLDHNMSISGFLRMKIEDFVNS